MPATMRAAFVTELGGADNIQVGEVEIPGAFGDDVLVKVEAAAVNHVDTYIRSGALPTAVPMPFIIGRDLVGTVVSDSPEFATGQKVWCNSLGYDGRQGACAEFAAVPAGRLYRLPSAVDPLAALAILHPAATAYLALHLYGQLKEDDTIVINGSGGAVGSAAVQMAAALGARVIAVDRTDNAQWARVCGACCVIDRDKPLADILATRTRQGIDVFLDTTGHVDLADVLPLIAVGGHVLLIAGLNHQTVLPIGILYTRDIVLRGMAISNAATGDLAQAAHAINGFLTRQQLQARQVITFELELAADAHRAQETRRFPGSRILVTIQ